MPAKGRCMLSPDDNETVSVVIGAFNRRELLMESLLSVLNSSYRGVEIVYVDQGSDDGTLEAIDADPLLRTNVRVLKTGRLSPSAARNHGARECSGSILLFLDSDAELSPETMGEAVKNFRDPGIGVVGAKIVDRQDRHSIVTAGMEFTLPLFVPIEGKRNRRRDFESRHYTFTVCEACMFVRSSLFEELGGFDERLYPYAEEGLDFCWRTWQKGMKVLYDPHPAYHGSAAGRQLIRTERESMKTTVFAISNGLLVYTKNGDWLSTISLPLMFMRYVAFCSRPGLWLLPLRGLTGYIRALSRFEGAQNGSPVEGRLSNLSIMTGISNLNRPG